MEKILNVPRRLVFLAGFVTLLTLHMNTYPRIVSLSSELGNKPPILLSMISYAAITAMLVLGIIPLKKLGTIKSETQTIVILSVTFLILVALAASSIIIPIYLMTLQT